MPEILDAGHEVICGTIGMGKSYWVLYKIVKGLMHGYPFCYIDPKGPRANTMSPPLQD